MRMKKMKEQNKTPTVETLVNEVDDLLQSMSTRAPITVVLGVVMARLMMHSKANGFDKEFKNIIIDVSNGEFEKKKTLQ